MNEKSKPGKGKNSDSRPPLASYTGDKYGAKEEKDRLSGQLRDVSREAMLNGRRDRVRIVALSRARPQSWLLTKPKH